MLPKMSSKSHDLSVSPFTALSVFCLLLYSAGFIRIEVKFNDHEQRLSTVEEVVSQMRQEMADTTMRAKSEKNRSVELFEGGNNQRGKLKRFKRKISNAAPFNKTTDIKEVLEDVVTSSFKKLCHNSGNFCPRGRPGPPGRRGRKGSQGVMGSPGRSGKQGIMGPPGIRGEKGIKGDTGAPGIPGMKGKPGESISPPVVAVSSSYLTVNESNTASLLCSASGNPAPQLTWSRVNGSFPGYRTKVTSEGLLRIDNVRLDDAGKYKCVAQNILGRKEEVASLVVHSKPKVILSFGPSYAEKGQNIILPECHVTSFPPAVITWLKVHDNISSARAVAKDGQLSILAAQKKDSGLYKCKASNHLGHSSSVTQLNIVELPHFTVRPPSHLNLGTIHNVTVDCQAAGDPKPKVTWRRERGELPVGRSEVSVTGKLNIWNPKVEDSGKYTCVAMSNIIFSKAFASMELTIEGCAPLGVADISRVPDERITASSFNIDKEQPSYGRLNETRGHGVWCAKTTTDRTDYLQVDMGAELQVCAVATQGHGGGVRVTSYKLKLSLDGKSFNTYTENNAAKVFPGNKHGRGILKHSLSSHVRARFVRFYPVTFHGWPCMSIEIFV